MQITWHGLNCVRLEGKDAVVILDPYGGDTGLKLPRSQADIVAVSSEDLDPSAVSGEPFVIDVPGEYEIKGVFIYGLPWTNKAGERRVLYRVNIDELSVGFLAAADAELNEKVLEDLEGVDVLLIPTGDEEGLNVKAAVEIVNQIEPRIVVPIDYHSEGLKLKRKDAQAFLKEVGAKAEEVDKLKLIKKDLPTDDRRFYLVNPS